MKNPHLLRFQPKPTSTRVSMLTVSSGQTVSTILREWPAGMAKFCKLCEHCGAFGDRCMIMVSERVEPSKAANFSSHGFKSQDR